MKKSGQFISFMGDGPSHRQAGIPRELADAIESMIRSHRWMGHRSMSGFATEACRKLMRECYEDIERRARVWAEPPPVELTRREQSEQAGFASGRVE